MGGQARTVLRSVHRWVSLVLGLPIALIAASGAAVDYWFEIDALAAPAFYAGDSAGPPLPLDRLAAAAHRAVPGARIENIFLNLDGRVAIISLTGPWGERLRDLALGRASGKVLGERWQDEALIERLYGFHTNLLLGDGARPLVLGLAVVFLALLASGAVLWWPAPARWRSALSLRLAAGARLIDLHAKAGIFSLALTALAGVTAVMLLLPLQSDGSAPAPLAAARPSPVQPLQSLLDAAQAASPGWQAVNVLGTENADEPLRVILWRPAGLVRREALRIVHVQRATGAVAEPSGTDRHETARSLHNGRIGGELGRVAMAIAGLLPLALWITGALVWWRKAKTQRGHGVTG